MTEPVAKAPMTEQERLELAMKLDGEVEEFMNGLERQRYEDGWPEDKWEEEMAKHPFFMKRVPEPGEEVHPLYEGMQQLKYDPAENTAEELAVNYKEDGNFYMKHKKFRMAVLGYTEGIAIKCQNADVNATLYNNRSAAQFFLQNYRSSYDDAMQALKYKPDYHKARWRAAQCADKLDKYDTCVDLCDQILHHDPNNEDAKALRKSCLDRKQKKLRDERKLTAAERRKKEQWEKVVGIIKNRKLTIEDLSAGEEITEKILKPTYPPLEDYPVHLGSDGNLEWPVTFCYPEFMFSDFQQSVSEMFPMQDIVHDLFMEPLENDREGNYVGENVNVYYLNRDLKKACLVDGKKCLKDVIQEKK